jgi:hypothetical protein
LPIYNFNGVLLNHQLHNKLNTLHPFKLNIDYRIIHIFNITNYINPFKDNNHKIITTTILDVFYSNINELSGKAIYSIYKNLISYNNYLYISFSKMPLLRYFVDNYKEPEIIFILRESEIAEEQHEVCDSVNHIINNRIDNININKFDIRNGIDLTIDKYLQIPRINYDLVYHLSYFSLTTK